MLDRLSAEERTKLREITVGPVDADPYNAGMLWIGLRLSVNSSTGLRMNPRELADLLDKGATYLAEIGYTVLDDDE